MRFSRLRLNGFKSFVDPTDLTIADGLTGVVGPNGCGKSNLLEALRWVMGESRPTAMRGGGMEDVIFAGAATRPARNFAEVAIHIDNLERRAPSAFNEMDHIEIVRRITRDAGSAYKVNARDARARDIQMLFADASTGSHSPALVRQGQIHELINARPHSRRRVLEEAAGISGLYQRRHEAEIKLNGVEQNLARVDDVAEQLAGQLDNLARQARQAARYREIGAGLRHAEGLMLYLRWREADRARASAEEALGEKSTAAASAERDAVRTARERQERDDAMTPLREEDAAAAAALQRLQVERDAISDREVRAREAVEALESRIGQLDRDIERENTLNGDAGESVARLDEEASRLAEAGKGHDGALAGAEEVAGEASAALEAGEATLAECTEEVARLAARHQSAQRQIDDSRKTLERSDAEAALASEAETQAADALERAEEALGESEKEVERAAADAANAERRLKEADEARTDAQAQEAEARAARSEAEGEHGALRSERDALVKLVALDSGGDGPVMDALRVDPGYEKALGAALADDLRAPIAGPDARSGWTELPAYPQPQSLPEGARALAEFVEAPGALARRLGQVGIVDAAEGVRLQPGLFPGQRLVTVEGDLWRWDGFRAGAEDAPSASALRLQQINRLEELERSLADSAGRAEAAAAAHEELKSRVAELTREDAEAREARRSSDGRLAEAGRERSRAEADRNISQGKLETARLAKARHDEETAAARMLLEEAEAAAAELPDLAAARAGVERVKQSVEAARITMMTRRAEHDELKRAGETRETRVGEIASEAASWKKRLDSAGARLAELVERKEASKSELAEANEQPAQIAASRESLAEGIAAAETRRRTAADALAEAETAQREAAAAEREAARLAGEAREGRAGAEARAEAARDAVASAAGRIAEAHQVKPEALLEGLDVDPAKLPSAERVEADVVKFRRQRDALGAVNLRAEDDAKAVQEEHDQLTREKADLEEAVVKLRSGIASLNREGRERLLTAFEQVNGNFSTLFSHLFGGGEAELVLVESDDPLEAGLEIMCQPPGKKLSTLSLMSGGEKTLAALALIFAVFQANPAPICVLDEVDAPLDDANVARFCDLLDEMTRQTETRFLIITHHAVTMARMDRLFGVTMGEQGVSQLVSVDLQKAEALVA